jgi:hypothetical protein
MPKRHTENMEVNVNGFVNLALMEGIGKSNTPCLEHKCLEQDLYLLIFEMFACGELAVQVCVLLPT